MAWRDRNDPSYGRDQLAQRLRGVLEQA